MNSRRQKYIEEVLEAMSGLQTVFHRDHGPMFRRHGFGMSHFKMMLNMAASDEGISVSELSKHMDITPAAITQLVDKLVHKGLVERFEDSKDRRVVRIRLTPGAQAKFTKIKHYYYDKMAGVFKDLSDKELEQLASILKKIEVDPADFERHEHRHKWRKIKQDLK